jgi:hypothetical protein
VLFKPDIVATTIDIQEFRKMSPNLKDSQEEPILIASAARINLQFLVKLVV